MPIQARTRRPERGQSAQTLEEFHELHEQIYKFQRPDQSVEIVSVGPGYDWSAAAAF